MKRIFATIVVLAVALIPASVSPVQAVEPKVEPVPSAQAYHFELTGIHCVTEELNKKSRYTVCAEAEEFTVPTQSGSSSSQFAKLRFFSLVQVKGKGKHLNPVEISSCWLVLNDPVGIRLNPERVCSPNQMNKAHGLWRIVQAVEPKVEPVSSASPYRFELTETKLEQKCVNRDIKKNTGSMICAYRMNFSMTAAPGVRAKTSIADIRYFDLVKVKGWGKYRKPVLKDSCWLVLGEPEPRFGKVPHECTANQLNRAHGLWKIVDAK